MYEPGARLGDALAAVLDVLSDGSVAGVARRSRPELGSDGLSRQNGFRNAGALLSAVNGSTAGDAKRLVQVGEATAPRPTLTGELAPPRHPHVAAAVSDGALSTIVTMLDRVALRADSTALDEVEAILAAQAPGLTAVR